MRLVCIILILCCSSASFGQSSSTNYSSNSDGLFLHGGYTSSTNYQSKTINLWGSSDSSSSLNYLHQSSIGFSVDSNTISLSEVDWFSAIKLYPNPFEQIIQFELPANFSNWKVSIINVNGSVIHEEEVNENNKTITLPNLAKGLYFARLQNGSQTVVKKILKL